MNIRQLFQWSKVSFALVLLLLAVSSTQAQPAQDGKLSPNQPQPNSASTLQQNQAKALFIDAGAAEEAAPGSIILRSRLATINFGLLKKGLQPRGQKRITLNLFDDTIYTAVLDRIEQNPSGSFTWIGHLENIALSNIILVVNEGQIAGQITLPAGEYNISHVANGRHRIAQINSNMLLTGDDDSVQPVLPTASFNNSLAPEASDDGSVIDIMVLYTDDAVAAHTTVTLESWAEMFMAYTNQAYINSNVNQRAALVYMGEVSYNEPGNLGDALSDVQAGNVANTHALRDAYHADLVILMVNDDGSGASSCSGLAYVQTNVTPSFEGFGYGTMKACSFGSGIFAHELGHTMGAQHDWYINASTSPYTYAHGYVDTTNHWATIMSYNSHCSALGFTCSRLTYFSNPSVSYNGAPMGVAAGTSTACTPGNAGNPLCDADVRSTFDSTDSNSAIFRSSQNTWIGNSGDWNDANNWIMDEGAPSGTTPVNRVPRTIDNVLIPTSPTGGNFPTISANADARDVTLETGATLDMTGGTLNVHGNWEEQGTAIFNGTGGMVVFKSSLNQSITNQAGSTFDNVQVGDGGSNITTLNGNIDINSNLTLKAGATLVAGSHTINLAGNWGDEGSGFASGTGNVIFDGATQTVDKVTTSTLFTEGFDAFPGCCTSGVPSGWARETISGGFGFAQGTLSAGNPTANRWWDTSDAWLHTFGVSLQTGTTYQIEYKYRSHGGGSQDFAVSLGTSQSSGSMSTLLHSVTNISSSSFATAIANFTVPADGIYYFGLHSQQNTGSGYGVFDDVELRGIQDITFYNLQIKSSDAATFNQNVAVQNNLSVDADGTMNLDMNEATVEGTVSNNGTLQQIRDISDRSGGTDYEFLILRDVAAANIKYYGTQITPDGGAPLGITTVSVRGNQNCTTNASDPLVQRCFDITPTNDESATIKYWFIEAERNGETLNTLQVWDYNGGGWVSVGTAASYGSGCGTDVGCWLQWTGISTYSPMVVGSVLPTGDPGSSSCSAPTAPTAMGINRVGTNVTIDWSGGTADFYEVWHGLNAPYFTPGADCAMAANCTVAATSPHSSGVWSTPGNNYAYVVVAGNSCGTSETAVSRVGDFSFGLEAGTP